MADKLRLYIPCPSCGGTGFLTIGTSTTESGNQECPTCKPNGAPLGPVEYDGLRHVYAGRFEEIEDE
jgi:hypothetical protein